MSAGEFFQQSPRDSQNGEDASLPFSFSSEPPDIRNWFSSYEYESPECSDVFRGLEEEGKDFFAKEQGEDYPIHSEQILSNFYEETSFENGNVAFSVESSQNEYLLELGSCNLEGKKDLLLEEDLVLKKTQANELSSSLNSDDMLITSKGNHKEMNHINNQIRSLQCEVLAKHDSANLKRKRNSLNSLTHEGTSNGEQTENARVMSENGFISTRNRVGSKRNAEMSQCVDFNGKGGSSFEQQRQTFLVRRALVDQTNVYFAEEAIAAEAPGKWQCPRQRKPYAGPPLKQLRMDRWVRRVL